MAKYSHQSIEKKWQDYWHTHHSFATTEDARYDKDKRAFILDMFPYPSGAGLHVGHPEGYTATDIYSRYLLANGFNVLHVMGFDSFGLPAENYAIQTGQHPRATTEKNIDRFRQQIKRLGFGYDWSREVSTHTPQYYQWTQWLFLQLYKKGLAYESNMPINWCPSCLTGLANEEVDAKGCCDRCHSQVSRRFIRQWVLKITSYAEQLLADLDDLDWPDAVKNMQKHWIGRSEGAKVHFAIAGHNQTITVYTTRPDTLFGATYVVLAPEHDLVQHIVPPSHRATVQLYQEQSAKKSDLERTDLAKDKTGVFSGAYAIHPLTGEQLPIWLSDYVLLGYGTGAVMAVPAHDERDYAFAQKFALPIKTVVQPLQGVAEGCFTQGGVAVHSDFINGMPTDQAKQAMTEHLVQHGLGEKSVNYRLRDWIFSRQRYWGEPIPIVHCSQCGQVPVPEDQLPLPLPEVASYKPTGTGESPLAGIEEWVQCSCPKCGQSARRETNTMPQWAGSCWYYLRYIDPHNTQEFCAKDKEQYWMPVDLYVGGAEHAVLHLLYARFWHKVLFDLGLVSSKEPFQRLINQGMILGENNQKMSKSLGNVVNPDDMIDAYGADALRMYEMFMGPLQMTKPWNTQGLAGISRFLSRVYDIAQRDMLDTEPSQALLALLHKTIKKVSADTAAIEMNTAIAQMMIFINEVSKEAVCYRQLWIPFVQLLAPYAPHLGQEMWQMLGYTNLVHQQAWPSYDEQLAEDKQIALGVQINGKVRADIMVDKGTSVAELEKLALAHPRIQELLDGKSVAKVIAVVDRIVNIVIK